jgi:hypothetical protein
MLNLFFICAGELCIFVLKKKDSNPEPTHTHNLSLQGRTLTRNFYKIMIMGKRNYILPKYRMKIRINLTLSIRLVLYILTVKVERVWLEEVCIVF